MALSVLTLKGVRPYELAYRAVYRSNLLDLKYEYYSRPILIYLVGILCLFVFIWLVLTNFIYLVSILCLFIFI